MLRKCLGVSRVYDCKDGYYMRIEELTGESQLYGLELLSDSNYQCSVGPDMIIKERIDKEEFYHVYIDYEYLKQFRCEKICQANLAVLSSRENIKYGRGGDQFNQDLINERGGGNFPY